MPVRYHPLGECLYVGVVVPPARVLANGIESDVVISSSHILQRAFLNEIAGFASLHFIFSGHTEIVIFRYHKSNPSFGIGNG